MEKVERNSNIELLRIVLMIMVVTLHFNNGEMGGAFNLVQDDAEIMDFRRFSALFQKELEYNGVLIQAVRQGGIFRVMPNYLITEEEIDFFKYSCVNAYENVMKNIKG